MNKELYKYQGAGNDFLIADNRDGRLSLTAEEISALCDRRYGIGADGLMLLESSPWYDFKMVYYNADGSGGMMCGNGGRCIAAFAADLGLGSNSPAERPDQSSPAEGPDQGSSTERPDQGSPAGTGKVLMFEAPDGPHEAQILTDEGGAKTVRLKMKAVRGIQMIDSDSYFLDTGTRHYVHFVPDVLDYDVFNEGRRIRNLPEFGPIGTNANFVTILPETDSQSASSRAIRVRTYEKGVEGETYACGTGIVASAIASFSHCYEGRKIDAPVHYTVFARKDTLAVDFLPDLSGNGENCSFTDIWLTGPAVYVAKIIV